ncbi:hypothetical protein BTVI_02035 [Pitangus sulphuratus]|nr:hypothetical protein BTVI_02035 [Pitangus sulphuratus]
MTSEHQQDSDDIDVPLTKQQKHPPEHASTSKAVGDDSCTTCDSCSTSFHLESHQSLQQETVMEQQEPQEKISNPSTKVLVGVDVGGLATTHLHCVTTTSDKSQERKVLIKHQDLGVTSA